MTFDQIAGMLWRWRLSLVVTALTCLVAVAVATFSLPKVYTATATLFVGVTDAADQSLAYDTSLSQQLARTFTALASNPNVAREVSRELPSQPSPDAVLASMSFAPVEGTQLISVTAEGRSRGDAELLANRYVAVFLRRARARFAQGETRASVAVAEPAIAAAVPAKPNIPLYLGMGTLLSLLLAAGVVLLRERLSDHVDVAEGDDRALELPIIGRIPLARRAGAPDREDAYRLLKANLDFAGSAKVVMVASAAPLEGKTTIVSGLAAAAARDGERVLVIEADLRHPTLGARLLEPKTEAVYSTVGLTNYLAGAANLEDVLVAQPTIGEIDVVWAGPLPPDPKSLLGSTEFGQLLAEVRDDYDRVLIDTCPISVGADVSVIASHADATVFVIDLHRTKRSSARAGLSQLEKARARVAGAVLNRVPALPSRSYGYPQGNRSIPNEHPERRRLRLR